LAQKTTAKNLKYQHIKKMNIAYSDKSIYNIIMQHHGRKIFEILEMSLTTFCAPATALALSILFDLRISWQFLLLITILPFIIYFFDYFDDEGIKEFRSRKLIVWILVFLILISLYIVIVYSNLTTLLFFAMLLLLGILYPLIFKKITQKIVGFKDYFVALNWNFLIIFYFCFFGINLTSGLLFMLVFIFIRDMINVNYCDIKDIHQDKNIGLKTIAMSLGRKRILLLIHWGNFLSILMLITGIWLKIIPIQSISLLIPVILIWMLIFLSSLKNKFNTFIVDLEYPLWLIVIILGKVLLK
jgi:4-hydroxybenzoate polyprenyltransferase